MRTRHRLLLALVLVGLAALPCHAQQDSPRLAIIPLNPIGVSKADAQAFTALLETALVQTGMFTVLEQSQVNVILDAQEQSMEDCTDESCAIEFGKLLAAEQILLGSISAVGEKHMLTAKVIDVTTGKNLRADTVSAQGITALTDQVELLAYKVAGLTQKTAGEEKIASAFAELFVETDPDGAEVSLNGVPKGRSPLLIDRVPVGSVTLEARKDNLYASRDVDVVASDLNQISLRLEVSVGNLFVRTQAREGVHLFMDGADMGLLGRGLFEKVPSGERQLVLRGGGYFWEGKATVQTGKTVTVEAYPQEVGSIEYSIPSGVSAEIAGAGYRRVLRGSGTLLDLLAGSYVATATGEDYESASARLTITRGATARYAPEMRLTAAGTRKALERQLMVELAAARSALGGRLSDNQVATAKALAEKARNAGFPEIAAEAEALAEGTGRKLAEQEEEDSRVVFQGRLDELRTLVLSGERAVTAGDVQQVAGLITEISGSGYSFPELVASGESVQAAATDLVGLYVQKAALQGKLAEIPARAARRGALNILPALLMIGCGIGVVPSIVYGVEAYDAYEAATSTVAAGVARKDVTLFSRLTLACGSGFVGGIVLIRLNNTWKTRQARRIEGSIERIDGQMDAVRAEVR